MATGREFLTVRGARAVLRVLLSVEVSGQAEPTPGATGRIEAAPVTSSPVDGPVRTCVP